MDHPTAEMYGVHAGQRVLVVGTATPFPNEWAVTIDIDPAAPAQIVGDGLWLPFSDKTFDLVVLDFTTNFVKPSDVPRLIAEARRVGKRVAGRCHVTPGKITVLPGPKQRFTHPKPPPGVEWVEIRTS